MSLKRIFVRVLLIFCFAGFSQSRAQNIVSNLDESKVPAYTLPDVLKMQNGREVKNVQEWNNTQRPYIYHLYEEIQFGKYPKKKVAIRYRLLEANNKAL